MFTKEWQTKVALDQLEEKQNSVTLECLDTDESFLLESVVFCDEPAEQVMRD